MIISGVVQPEMLVCQICGNFIRSKISNCSACGAIVSPHNATAIPMISQATTPLAVPVRSDPQLLERAVAHKELAVLHSGGGSDRSYGAGGYASSGSGYGSSSGYVDEPQELDFAPAISIDR